MAIDIALEDLSGFDPKFDAVEFKLTLRPDQSAGVHRLLRKHVVEPKRRKVYFYDTQDLALDAAHVVLRARENQGDDDDSTVKIRPIDLDAADAPWRAFKQSVKETEIELDVAGGNKVPSAKLDREALDSGLIDDVKDDNAKIKSLFTKDQQKLIERYLPAVSYDDLEVLGPVDAHKWEVDGIKGFDWELCIEKWSLPDASDFIELSFKVEPDEAAKAEKSFASLLESFEIEPPGGQKTARVLRFFADRLE